MTVRREPVRLELRDDFAGRIRLIREAARTWGNDLALQQATWEPHDWTEWP